MTGVRKHAFALLAGVVLATGAPPFDVMPALWVGMAALAWALDEDPAWPPFASRARVALTGARRGLLFGVGANVVALRFIPATVSGFTPLPWVVGAMGLLLLAAFEATRWMVAAVGYETLVRARVPRPLAFAAGVYAGTFVPTMMPWTPAGGASPWPSMIQLADVVGERGVTALMALAAGLVAYGMRVLLSRSDARRGLAACAGGVLLVVAQGLLGKLRIAAVDRDRDAAPHASVGLVQPSVGASTRWDEARAPAILEELRSLTRRSEAAGAELVVWHETAYPYRLPHGITFLPPGGRSIEGEGVHGAVLTGVLLATPDGESSFNSAVVVSPDGRVSPSYDKRHLLWFGETVPLADRIPLFRRIFARGLGLTPGDREVPLLSGRIRAAVLVCYEDMLPEAGREAATVDPNLLVNVTNDAWFHGSAESELHLRVATLRAVELRRDMVRAVNLGPTSWVDAAGRVRARASSDFPSVLESQPALLGGAPTLYARWGDAPWAALLLALANLAVWRRARHAAK